jgi:hypothetical protein
MALADYAAAFRSRKIALLLVLGFASGLPLALTAGTLQAWLAAENVDIVAIGSSASPTPTNSSGRRSWTAMRRRSSAGAAAGCW